jgi:TPR repeat protein
MFFVWRTLVLFAVSVMALGAQAQQQPSPGSNPPAAQPAPAPAEPTAGAPLPSAAASAPALPGVAIAAPSATLRAAAADPDSELTLAIFLRRQAIAFENGEGVDRDLPLAASLYCKAARLGDPEAQYNLGWMYANDRGVQRDDLAAAYFFNAAAEQGLEAAKRMLARVGGPTPHVPECMKDPPPPPVRLAAKRPIKPPVDYLFIAPRHIYDLVQRQALLTKVDAQLTFAIIHAESNFDSLARSPKNAQGLMQLIPETAARFGIRNAYDPAQNIRAGVAYLRWLLAYFEGDVALVAAAYNAGEGTVERYRGIPPYLETRAYVLRVLKAVGVGTLPFDASVTLPSPALLTMRRPNGITLRRY